jgi:hypothetical protein
MNAVASLRPQEPPPTEHTVAAQDGPLWQHPALRGLVDSSLPLQQRLPAPDDPTRWVVHPIDGQTYRFAQPITFTPYASWQPCSARCRFCSENLRQPGAGPAAAQLRPGADYFVGLAEALARLCPLPLSWSLSGLENTDAPGALMQLLTVLEDAERAGQAVEQRVLYSNGAGFAGPQGAELIAALQDFGLTGLEFSRHHHDAARNQAIMRFGPEHDALVVDVTPLLHRLRNSLPLKLVCVLQRGGVDAVDDLAGYLDWARSIGVGTVIFRELARLDGDYLPNQTARYVTQARIDVAGLAGAALQAGVHGLAPFARTQGYYFSNLRCRTRAGIEVVFEAADYASMHARHASDRVYKLIHFANGELAADWQPGWRTLWRAPAGP